MRTSPESRAAALLRRHEITKIPVPVETIIAAEGFRVGRKSHDGPEFGFVLRNEGTVIIGVNTNTSGRRQRDALAHCLGHALLHTEDLILCYTARLGTRDRGKAVATDRMESEANAFSAELVMPTGAFVAAVDKFAGGRPDGEHPAPRDELVGHLARTFGVASEAVTYRLVALGLLAV